MSTVQIDHVLTFANVSNIDDYVEEYRTRGFIVNEATHRYEPGLRNRFVGLGCEYIELVWVEDEVAFTAGGTEEFARMFPNLDALRTLTRPFSIGFKSPSVEALHRTWTGQGIDLPSIWSFTPPDQPPVFSFQTIPNTLLSGVSGFALTYHSEDSSNVLYVKTAPNTIYALEGITLVCATPEINATYWHNLLAPGDAIQERDEIFTISVGAHKIHWITPTQYHKRYNLDWVESLHDSVGIAAFHLLVTDIDKAEAMLGETCIRNTYNENPFLVIPPDPRDGLTFIIRECPIETWRTGRIALTGERLIVEDSEISRL